jgi:hypothetical protein
LRVSEVTLRILESSLGVYSFSFILEYTRLIFK